LAPFEEAVNPYKRGTQVRIKEIGTVPPPALPNADNDAYQIAYSSKHGLLFLRTPAWVLVYDVVNKATLNRLQTDGVFSGLSLTGDESVLYAADSKEKQVHRYDLATRTQTSATFKFGCGPRLRALAASSTRSANWPTAAA